MIPSAKMDALLKAPPRKVSSKPNNPCAEKFIRSGSIPGSTTNDPKRNIVINKRVLRIRVLNSSIEKIFLIVSINRFIKKVLYSLGFVQTSKLARYQQDYNLMALPPAFSIASMALFEKP